MRKTILTVTALTLLSCGYSIKSDRDIQTLEYEIGEKKETLESMENEKKELEIKLAGVILSNSLILERYKDSIEFTKLNKLMCWDKKDHRHSCEIYGNPLMKATNEAINEQQPVKATSEKSELAINE